MKLLNLATNHSLNIITHPPFVIGGDLSKKDLLNLTNFHIIPSAKIMWKDYFIKKPNKVITILMFHGQKSYRKWALELLNEKNPTYFGYYLNSIKTLIMDINTGNGTLIHELTHSLIDFDYPEVPLWFNEGLASLHEAVFIHKNRLEGLINWRLPILKEAIKNKTLKSLSELVLNRQWEKNTDVNYAQSRYFMMFTQKKHLLKKFYRIHKKGIKTNKYNDIKAIEITFGEKIDNIEKEFLHWINKIP